LLNIVGTPQSREHPPLVGGVWGFVDEEWRRVLQAKETRNHPKRYRNKRASVHLSV
jgi:hypothetical protein